MNASDENFRALELKASVTIPAHAYLSKNPQAEDWILLLHGYGQTAKDFAREMSPDLDRHSICTLQAPFPVPVKGRIGYSWYAYDVSTDTFQIPMSAAVDFAKQALDQLQVTSKIFRVIGFSQGGYFAPFLALTLPNVQQVIGINCRFKDEDLSKQVLPFRLDAIHGANDPLVDPERARLSHQALLENGARGTFRLLPDTSHGLSPLIGQAIQETLGFVKLNR